MLILFEVSSRRVHNRGTMQKFRFSNPIHCQSAVLIRLGRGVRPWSWTGSRGGFDPLPGVLILELRGAQVAERGVQPASVVDLVNERITGGLTAGMVWPTPRKRWMVSMNLATEIGFDK